MNLAAELVDHVEHWATRVIQDALATASAEQWEKRAQTFEQARPRPGDFHGNASRSDLQARYDRLTEAAEACRARSRVSLLGGEEW